jgi:hypothetical protein
MSSGSQPFQLFASSIDPLGTTLLLASATTDDASTVVVAVSRLATALANIQWHGGGGVSWLVVNESRPMPAIDLMKTLCPSVMRCVDLTGCSPKAVDALQPPDIRDSRVSDIDVIYGPKMAYMNQDPALKKSFWITLQQWMSQSVDATVSRDH